MSFEFAKSGEQTSRPRTTSSSTTVQVVFPGTDHLRHQVQDTTQAPYNSIGRLRVAMRGTLPGPRSSAVPACYNRLSRLRQESPLAARYYDYPLSPSLPVWPGDSGVRLERSRFVDGDNVVHATQLRFGSEQLAGGSL